MFFVFKVILFNEPYPVISHIIPIFVVEILLVETHYKTKYSYASYQKYMYYVSQTNHIFLNCDTFSLTKSLNCL